MLVCLKYDLQGRLGILKGHSSRSTYDNTLENSLDGDMTKLSLVLDHEMRC
jgi:hypothetical protein